MINGESLYVFAVKFIDPLKDEIKLAKADKPISPRYTHSLVMQMIQDRELYKNYVKTFEDLPIDHRRYMVPQVFIQSLRAEYQQAAQQEQEKIRRELLRIHLEFPVVHPWPYKKLPHREEHESLDSKHHSDYWNYIYNRIHPVLNSESTPPL